MRLISKFQCPLKPPLAQTTKSHAGRAENYKISEQNIIILEVERKEKNKIPTISHTQHRAPPIPIPNLNQKGRMET